MLEFLNFVLGIALQRAFYYLLRWWHPEISHARASVLATVYAIAAVLGFNLNRL